jgi:hypothetical protein
MDFTEIIKDRVSDDEDLIEILDLGEQYLTGVFPKTKNEKISRGPVQLVFSKKSSLLQMRQTYNLEEMYGENYGYRSGLNNSMVDHLEMKISILESKYKVSGNDNVLDIGSNDGTGLSFYSNPNKYGIDPSAEKFRKYYQDDVNLAIDFFSYNAIHKNFGAKKFKIITSIAMFYDLNDPISFCKDIYKTLQDEGIWHFEQSYLPLMIETLNFDTVCQEHIEYYSLTSIYNILSKAELKIIDIEFNDINGGSIGVTATKNTSKFQTSEYVNYILEKERREGYKDGSALMDFQKKVNQHKSEIEKLLLLLKKQGKSIVGYGASTKGNVLLQYCKIDNSILDCIVEVNEDKFGRFTPGTNIPIVSDEYLVTHKPDYCFVLPWHFKSSILTREKEYRKLGGKFIFPMPNLVII